MSESTETRCAIWARVSTSSQDTDSQKPDIQQFVKARGLTPVSTYVVTDSAWHNGGGTEYRETLNAALADAWAGKFSFLVVWALDRICRGGAREALQIVKDFKDRGCTLVSVKEPWLNATPEIADILIAFAGWMAHMESQRRSERVRAGIEAKRAREPGWAPGRQQGAADRKPRRRSGYVRRWERAREESAVQVAARPEVTDGVWSGW